jgi:predicted RNase H-like nuclease
MDAAMTIVDMPIGLADADRRHCEFLARRKLTPGRTSSVFSSPRRPMLGFASYAEANAWGKAQQQNGGLSKQAWMIAPKIREIDDVITPADQARLGEGHPEVAFARLKGGPCAFAKRKPEGQRERLQLLKRAGVTNAEDIYLALRAEHGGQAVGRDDVYDACVLALTAKARLENRALRLSDDARDARGLLMEIWG